MPELPEVQTIVNDVQSLIGQRLVGFCSDFEKAIKGDSLASLRKKIIGTIIVGIERVGKNIALVLDSGSALSIHLKMTGKLILENTRTQDACNYLETRQDKHFHHVFVFNKSVLEFHDIRKFATLELLNKNQWEEKLARQAMDPAKKNFSFVTFHEIMQSQKNKKIKPVLMDGAIVAGIGNIYASEILFDANVLPHRTIASLTRKELRTIYESTKNIIKKAIALRGTSVSDYRDGQGKKGLFQNHLRVYKKHGGNCPTCGTIIVRTVIAQRSSFHCPQCQH